MNTTYQPISMEQALVTRVSQQELCKWTEESALPYRELMAFYRCAAASVKSMLQTAGEEYALRHGRDPIEDVEAEMKTPERIIDRMLADGIPLTAAGIEQHINDCASVRVICSFQSDVYEVADALLKQDDAALLKKEDFIANPKDSGYRGLHLLVTVPVVLNGQKRRMKVEARLLTPAMEFWADTAEKFHQAKDVIVPEQIAEELHSCALLTTELDERLEQIRYNVEHRVITK